jgi:glycosyltransferase involved in cell wall biosynthesis
MPTSKNEMINKLLKMVLRRPVGTVAINMKPVSGSWGGSSVFVWQLMSTLQRYGYKVRFDLKKKVDVIILIDPREDLTRKAFGLQDIKNYKKINPRVSIVHRINECDQRKGTDFMDRQLEEANQLADYTVYISKWLRDYFVQRWFNPDLPHKVIYNGADPSVFHPIGSALYESEKETMRIVTHHWSDNPMKGFPIYKKLDEMISSKELTGFEFWVIGRWPADLSWQSAITFPPTSGKKLGDLLRQCHLYITASLWEPCGMHHVEGAQCGLPLVYHLDGGGIAEAGIKYGMGFRNNLKDVLLAARKDYSLLKQEVMFNMPNGDRMAFEFVQIIQHLLAPSGFEGTSSKLNDKHKSS